MFEKLKVVKIKVLNLLDTINSNIFGSQFQSNTAGKLIDGCFRHVVSQNSRELNKDLE